MDPNTLGLILIAVLNCGATILAWVTRRDIRKIEIATNSMKDALIRNAHAAGREEMRKEQEK